MARRPDEYGQMVNVPVEWRQRVDELAAREKVTKQHAWRQLIKRGLEAVEADPNPHPLGIPGVTARRAPRALPRAAQRETRTWLRARSAERAQQREDARSPKTAKQG